MASALVIGASRGIGLGLVREFVARGYEVTGTVRAAASAGGLEIGGGVPSRQGADRDHRHHRHRLDRSAPRPPQGAGVRHRHRQCRSGRATQKNPRTVDDKDFAHLFITNALGPVRVAEILAANIRPKTGVVGFMTSQLGSIANNNGGMELYRASKAALNSFGRSFAARHRDKGFAVLLLHPGWVRTDMGGAGAAIDVETSARGLADVAERAERDRRDGFFDYQGDELPW